jgi:hypothetical protein
VLATFAAVATPFAAVLAPFVAMDARVVTRLTMFVKNV